jgi:hypothetical protein
MVRRGFPRNRLRCLLHLMLVLSVRGAGVAGSGRGRVTRDTPTSTPTRARARRRSHCPAIPMSAGGPGFLSGGFLGGCREQLTELQHHLARLQVAGVAVMVLSSDTPEVATRTASTLGQRLAREGEGGLVVMRAR